MRLLADGVLTAAAVAAFSSVTPTGAGGLYLGEFDIPDTGTAGAGSNAIANDATTAITNPAGMTRLKGNALTLAGGLIVSNTEFNTESTTFSGGDGGEQGGLARLCGSR